MAGAQKQRSGLIRGDRSATFRLARTVWLHTAPPQLPKQARTCWTEAPHHGAQSDALAASTGRPEIAVHCRMGSRPYGMKASTGGLRSSPPGGHRYTPPQVPPGTLTGTTAGCGAPCNGWLRSVLSTHKPCPPSGPEQASPRATESAQMGEGVGICAERVSSEEERYSPPPLGTPAPLPLRGRRLRGPH